MILFLLSTALALVLRYWGKPLLIDLYIYHLDICDTSTCLGIGGVNRVSFTLFLFFAFHALLLYGVRSCARVDTHSWCWKLLGFLVLLIFAWLLPNSFYAVYMHIARIISAFFLLLQLVILIDFAYQWNESWTSDERQWNKAVLVVSGLMLVACIVWFALDLVYLADTAHGSCHLQKFFIAFTLVLTFFMTCLSISDYVGEGGGLLPACIVTLYAYWLLFSALTSDPSTCNTVSSRSKELAPMVVGLLLSAGSVTYASWSVATNSSLFGGDAAAAAQHQYLDHESGDDAARATGSTRTSAPKAALVDDAHDAEIGRDVISPSALSDDDQEEGQIQSANVAERVKLSGRFHLLMAAASMYMCMLLSAWGSQHTAEQGADGELSRTNMWIKISTQWCCILLYAWTLIAPRIVPRICPQREFS